jgi:hypothetical protein
MTSVYLHVFLAISSKLSYPTVMMYVCVKNSFTESFFWPNDVDVI